MEEARIHKCLTKGAKTAEEVDEIIECLKKEE
jgi:hypothetical protein